MAILPMALYFGAYMAYFLIAGPWPFINGTPLLLTAFVGLASIPFVVAWHRLILIGPDVVMGHWGFSAGMREWRFILWGIGFGLVLGLAAGIVGGVLGGVLGSVVGALGLSPHMGTLIAVAAGALLGILCVAPIYRIGLVFPAIAKDEEASWSRMWNLGKGNTFRLTWALIVAVVVIHLAFILLAMGVGILLALAKMQGMTAQIVVRGVIETLTYFLSFAVGAGILSTAYRHLTESRVVPGE